MNPFNTIRATCVVLHIDLLKPKKVFYVYDLSYSISKARSTQPSTLRGTVK